MRLRDLMKDDREQGSTVPATPGNEELDRLRASGEELLAAGAAAINRALSRDSEKFLRDSRQHGGQ